MNQIDTHIHAIGHLRRRAVTCPSCSMQASRSDMRLLAPVIVDDPDLVESELRRCRNCTATIDLSMPEPRVLVALD